MKLLILGGGIAGCVASAHAVRSGISEVTILEREKHLGGLHQDVVINNTHFDTGNFVFWPDHKVFELFPGLTKHMIPIEKFYFRSLSDKGNLDFYPPTVQGYIKDWGIASFLTESVDLILSRIKHQLIGDKFKSVDDELRYYMGNFYEKMGLCNYVRRLYGMNPSEVSTEFFTIRLQFIKEQLSIIQAFKKLIMFNFSAIGRYNNVTNLYTRPINGFSSVYSYIERKLHEQSVNIQFGSDIDKIILGEKKVIMKDDTVHSYDYLLSSIPLHILCKLSKILLPLRLNFKPLYSLFYEFDTQSIPDCHVLFNFTEKGFWKRITFHSSYYGNSNNKGYFVVESMSDKFESCAETVTLLDKDFKDTFEGTTYISLVESAKLVGSKVVPNAYPIYTKDFDVSIIHNIKKILASQSVYLVGRQGEFNYIASSDVAKNSIKVVDEILTDYGIEIE